MTQAPYFTGKIIDEAEVDRSLWKIFVLIGLTFIFYFITIFSWQDFFSNLTFSKFWLSLILSFLFLGFSLLDIFLIKNFSKFIFLSFLIAFSPFILFYPKYLPFLNILVAGSIFLFFFLIKNFKKGIDFVKNSVKIHFFKTASYILPKLVTVFLVFLALLFFINYYHFQEEKFNQKINSSLINFLFQNFLGLSKFLDLEIKEDVKTDDFLKAILKKRINNLVPKFDQYHPNVQDEIFEKVFKEFRGKIEKFIGPFDGNLNFKENLILIFNRFLDNLSSSSKLIFALFMSFGFFLIIKGIFIFFGWLIEIISFIFYKILILINFAQVRIETKSREFVILS